MKIGDLVRIVKSRRSAPHDGRGAIVTRLCSPAEHRNGMALVQVLHNGSLVWYPQSYMVVINEGR